MKISSLIIGGNEEIKLRQHTQSFPKTPRRQCRMLISLFRVKCTPTPSTVAVAARAQCLNFTVERDFRLKLFKSCLLKHFMQQQMLETSV